jgi:predicted transposase/invertase (TIGR01784 family)
MNNVASPHDKFFKLSLQEVRIAKDFFKHHLPEKIQKQVDFNTLHLESGSFIDQEQRAHFSDVLYSVEIDKKPGYLFILAEHQSSPDKLMPFRVLKYMCLVWDKHVKSQPAPKRAEELPIIYPLIFYHGRERPYPYSCDMIDCFTDKVLAKEILHGSVQLIDVTQIPDDQLKQHGTAALFELLQKHIFTRNMQGFLKDIIEGKLFQSLRERVNGEYLVHVIKYVVNQAELQDVNKFFEELTEALPTEEEKIMTIAEQLRQQGMQQGMQKGFNNAMNQVAKNLLEELKDLDKVAKILGLSRQELEKIVHSYN